MGKIIGGKGVKEKIWVNFNKHLMKCGDKHRRTIIILNSIVEILILLCFSAFAGDNLIINPGFEEGEQGKNELVGWRQSPFQSGVVSKVDDTCSRSGDKSLMLYVPNDVETDWYGWTARIPVKPNTEYNISYWIKSKDVHDASGLVLSVHEITREIESCNHYPLFPSKNYGTIDWERVEKTFQTTSETVNLDICANFNTRGTIWVDDFCLIALPGTPDNFPLQKEQEKGKKSEYEKLQKDLKRKGTYILEADLYGSGGTNSFGEIYMRMVGESEKMLIGSWSPVVVVSSDVDKSLTPVTIHIDVSDKITTDGVYYISFDYTKGNHAVFITETRLKYNDKTLVDSHKGFAGNPEINNVYKFQIGEIKESDKSSKITLIKIKDFDNSGIAQYDIFISEDGTYELFVKYTRLLYDGNRGTPVFFDSDCIGFLGMQTKTDRALDNTWAKVGNIKATKGHHTIFFRRNDLNRNISAAVLKFIDENPSDNFESKNYWNYKPRIGDTEGTKNYLSEDRIEGKYSLRCDYVFQNNNAEIFFGDDSIIIKKEGNWNLSKYNGLKIWVKGDGTKNLLSIGCLDEKNNIKNFGFIDLQNTSWKEYIFPFDIAQTFAGNIFNEKKITAICITLDKYNEYSGKSINGFFLIDKMSFRAGDILAKVVIDELNDLERKNILEASERIKEISDSAYKENIPSSKMWCMNKTKFLELLTPAQRLQQNVNISIENFYGYVQAGIPHLEQWLNRYFDPYDFGKLLVLHITPNTIDEFSSKFPVILSEVKKRNLFLSFGFAGLLPGKEVPILKEQHKIILKNYKEYFLGYQDGENDLHFFQEYMDEYSPHKTRIEAYNNYMSYLNKIKTSLYDNCISLGALNFCHYYGEIGYKMLGLELVQALPSDIMRLSFLRGAGKQYSIPWWVVVSVYNRWELKDHGGTGISDNYYVSGPKRGPSKSLMERLWYLSYLYGSSFIGFEDPGFLPVRDNNIPELSEVGVMQLQALEWAKKHPRGKQYTPVALLLDHYSGWLPPKHAGGRLGSYKVWGRIPYSKGDYMIDNFFRLIYPGYHFSNFYEDERGCITPTPFGDIFDVLLSDVSLEVLNKYKSVIVLGEVTFDELLKNKLIQYVKNGGILITGSYQWGTGKNEFLGINKLDKTYQAYCSLSLPDKKIFTEGIYTYDIVEPKTATVIAINELEHPLVLANQYGRGKVFVVTPHYWMGEKIEQFDPHYQFLNVVIHIVEKLTRKMNVIKFDNENLQYIVNQLPQTDEILLTIVNNTRENQECKVEFNDTKIEQVIDYLNDKKIIGFRESLREEIPMGQLRIYKVKTKEPFKL